MQVVSAEALPEHDLRSLQRAVAQEIADAGDSPRPSLAIDGLEAVRSAGGKFLYRVALSSPINVSPEQTLSFRDKSSNEQVTAVVVGCDDDGLVVETDRPLPSDARLLDVTFDPSFILKALAEFFQRATATAVSRSVLRKDFPSLRRPSGRRHADLNEEQSAAVEEMQAVPVHFLWGPPGTGKTTTLGVAVAGWLAQKKSVLVASTSNAAVDVAMASMLRRVRPQDRKHLLRLGTTTDPKVGTITAEGRLAAVEVEAAIAVNAAQKRLTEITERLRERTLSNERYRQLWDERARLESVVSAFSRRAAEAAAALVPAAAVVGCTLAKMVLDKGVYERTFDVVVVDEASMVSLAYALAASTLTRSHLVYAGDPQQLPPICQSRRDEAEKWFGRNVYDFAGVGRNGTELSRSQILFPLRTQYRMTDRIGGLVGRLGYGDILRHGRNVPGVPVEFVDLPDEWQTTHYSVEEKSYYHPASVPVIHRLAKDLEGYQELLLLSPFRPQRSLLAALAFDLRRRFPGFTKVSASTIHRSQGAEARAVIVDLTTHSHRHLARFFKDRHSANLFNVAISRAKDRLIVIGGRRMLRALTADDPYWAALWAELRDGNVSVLPAEELLEEGRAVPEIGPAPGAGEPLPAIYCFTGPGNPPQMDILRRARASRKLLVLPKDGSYAGPAENCVVRHAAEAPPLLAAHGRLCLPLGGRWVCTDSPNAARVIWRIGFSHLADEEVDPGRAMRFFCPECATGELRLRQYRGEGWFLVCSNSQGFECHYRRRLSLEDAKLKVRLTGMTCPDGHPLTVRQGPKAYFLSCENYPQCDHSESLSILSGI